MVKFSVAVKFAVTNETPDECVKYSNSVKETPGECVKYLAERHSVITNANSDHISHLFQRFYS